MLKYKENYLNDKERWKAFSTQYFVKLTKLKHNLKIIETMEPYTKTMN